MRALAIFWLSLAAMAASGAIACQTAAPAPAGAPVLAAPVAPAARVRPRSHDAADSTVAAADGVPIRYHAEGSGEPALVFIHGWSGDRSHWAEQVTRFSGDREVIALDLAGHGDSGRDRKEWTIESLGGDVRAVVVALGLRRVVLIGHSMGGPVALAAASGMAERIAGVIGIDTFHDVERRIDPALVQSLVGRWEKDFGGTAKAMVDAMLPASTDAALRERLQAQFAAAPPDVALALLRAQLDFDLAAAFEHVHAPIRAINTTQPTNVDAGHRHGDFAAVDLAALQLGHFPMLTAPDLFDQKLAETLSGLGVAAGKIGQAMQPLRPRPGWLDRR